MFWRFLPDWRASHGQGQWRQRNDDSDENDRRKIRNIDNHHKKFEFGQFVGDFVEIFWPGSKWKCWVILESQGQNAEANSRTWTAKLQIHLFEAVWKMKRNCVNLFNESLSIYKLFNISYFWFVKFSWCLKQLSIARLGSALQLLYIFLCTRSGLNNRT